VDTSRSSDLRAPRGIGCSRANVTEGAGSGSFEIKPVSPFRLDLTTWALRRRSQNAIDRWDGHTYRRTLILGAAAVDVAVTQTTKPSAPTLQVVVTGDASGYQVDTTRALERLLGLRVDLRGFSRFAGGDPQLSVLERRFRGVKPPRFASLFEGMANAVACQQLTLDVGIHLLNRLARTYGWPAPTTELPAAYAFPRPEEIRDAKPEALRGLGFSRAKADALINIAARVASGEFSLDALADEDNERAAATVQRERGFGRWSAEYVLLRTLGRLDVFPGDDVGARNKLQHWLDLDSPPNYDEIHSVLARWSPFAGLVYFHLLLDGLAESGQI
jgi:DNA-3-methyladenine glycosylase II